MDILEADVVILGAGVAGLSAACHLRERGVQRIVVLEGRDRIGGRVSMWRPPELPDSPFEYCLGGSWIHGTKGNPLTKLARELQIRMTVTHKAPSVDKDPDTALMFDAVDRVWVPYEKVAKLYERLHADLSDLPHEKLVPQERARGVLHLLNRRYAKRSLSPASRRIIECAKYDWMTYCGADLASVDVQDFDDPDGEYGALLPAPP